MMIIPLCENKELLKERDVAIKFFADNIQKADGWALILKSTNNADIHPEFHHRQPGNEYQLVGLLETIKQIMLGEIIDGN